MRKAAKGFSSEVWLVKEKRPHAKRRAVAVKIHATGQPTGQPLPAHARVGKHKAQSKSSLARKQRAHMALKIERSKSRRMGMVEKETRNLTIANALGIGPKLLATDVKNRAILMEFIEGQTLAEFVFSLAQKKNPRAARNRLASVLRNLFAQAQKLDAAGLDHGQIAGRGANIIVRKTKRSLEHRTGGKPCRTAHCFEPGRSAHCFEPVISDFEKASTSRRCHNVTRLAALVALNPHSALTRRIRETFASAGN